jgi:uncharacterized protein (TIGR03437 family)
MASPTVGIAAETSPPPSGVRRRTLFALWLAAAGGLFAVVYLSALALHAYRSGAGYQSGLTSLGSRLLDTRGKDIAEGIAAALCIFAGLAAPRFQWQWLRRAEQAFARFAGNRTQAILFVGALPLIVRIALLPVLGVPGPLVADEFGYLLLADTFASGRLTNPTHPFWKHFETVYVFHQPTYASIYPFAPAILLAIPKLIGVHPWLGVWFGAGLMCALVCWMLQGWLPPKWALLGGLLAVFRFSLVSSWMNTYWGGATAAIGGLLILGALPRIMKQQRRRDSVLFGLGLAILAQSRPYEGILFALPPMLLLGVWLLRERSVLARIRWRNVALPLGAVMAALVAATAYYDWRVTGDPLLMPYILHQRIYGTPQTLFWQAPIQDAPGVHEYRDIADVFQWQLAAHRKGFSWGQEAERLESFWHFYLQPLLSLPLLLLPLVLRRRYLWVLLLSAIALLAGNAMYPFFFPHYAAPLCGLIILFVVYGMRYLRVLTFRARAGGALVFRLLFLLIGVSTLCITAGGLLQPWHVAATFTSRDQVLKQLKERGGKHLVLVRYSPNHEFHYGVVFNDADIDRSQVVWAHQLDMASNRALISYYADREAWVFNPDEMPVTLIPATNKPYISVLAAGAGRRDDSRDGVSPGGIAVLFGGNFAGGVRGTTNPRPLGRLPFRLTGTSAEYGNLFEPATGGSTSDGSTSGDAGKFPFETGKISVQFGTTPAPILAVSNVDGQESVTVQVPFEIPTGWTPVTLRADGLSVTGRVQVLPATPGIFQVKMSDSIVRGIVLRTDGSVVDLEHPAHPGDVLRLFATGLGPLLPVVRTNQPGIEPPNSAPMWRLIIGVNHQGVPLVSARYAARMVGVEEITFQIPPNVPPGTDIPLSVGVVVDGKTVYSNKSSLPVK